ncbi:MAG: hypothetical protein ABEJ04_00015, partial [Halobacteriaceae archaeon]
MDTTLVFDVEDPVTPESDDVAKWLAETLTEEDVEATFFVTGAKARALEERGRDDVVAALARHDVGFHSDTHSVHPTVSEYLEDAGWEEGVAEVRRRELDGLADVERVFGTDARAFGLTGGSYAPQVGTALAASGLAFAYSPFSLPTAEVYRYAGALTFGSHTRGFDETYADTDAFEERLDWLADHLESRAAEGADWVGVFGAHPTTVRATEFWDGVNFADGANPPREEREAPPLRPESAMETARENFRRLVRFLRDHDLVSLRTVGDLADEYAAASAGAPAGVDGERLVARAARFVRSDALAVDDPLSPAEATAAFADALLATDPVPARLGRRDVLGPTADPPRDP